jgi:hypothetical protein
MFEPQHTFLDDYDYEFLGSVEGIDLWLDKDGDVRAYHPDGSWDYFSVRGSSNDLVRVTNDTSMTTKSLFLIKRYLRAFCPDLGSRAKHMQTLPRHLDDDEDEL